MSAGVIYAITLGVCFSVLCVSIFLIGFTRGSRHD